MSHDDPSAPQDISEVATHFRKLWDALTISGGQPRAEDERRMLIDRARDALDRSLERLEDGPPPLFIADTFAVQNTLYEGERTHIHCLCHRDLGTDFVLKTLSPIYADDAHARDLFLREARLHLSLADPHIVTAHMLLRLPDGRPGLILEKMDGGSLAKLLARKSEVPLRAIHSATQAVLLAVKATHTTGLVHCDITPSNLLLASDDLTSIKLGDFGIALPNGENHASLGLARAGSSVDGHAEPSADLRQCGDIVSLLLQHRSDDGPSANPLKTLAAALGSEITDATEALRRLQSMGPPAQAG